MAQKRPPNAEATQFRSGEQAVENGRKGGVASAKAKRERKALNDTLNELFAMPIKNGKTTDIEAIKSLQAVKDKNITVQEALLVVQIHKALKGDPRAARLLFELIEGAPAGTSAQEGAHNALVDAIRNRNNEA